MAQVPDPAAAVRALERLKQASPDAFARWTERPQRLHLFLAVAAHSRFLLDEVIAHPEWLDWACCDLARCLDAAIQVERLEAWLESQETGLVPLVLAQFRRRELLRILLRDVLQEGTIGEITSEISAVADAVLQVAYRHIRQQLAVRHGDPQCGAACGFSVVALGKLGGEELNYSSDIDLMFVYGGQGETDGAERITNREFFKKVANQLTALLSTYTAEGLCYRVDLRLRPDGRLGEVCTSLEGAKSYYQDRARDWELQMLIKARVAAGEPEPGAALLAFVEPLIYQSTLDFEAVEAVSQARQRIHEKLTARRPGEEQRDVKLSPGGIRDVEFLVQCLQRLHGGREPWVRHGGTLLALGRLRDKGFLSLHEYAQLADAYGFLRAVEHRLQFWDDRQTHLLPSAPEELDALARRLPVGEVGGIWSGERLVEKLDAHRGRVREVYERVIHAQQATAGESPRPAEGSTTRLLEQRVPSLAAALQRGARLLPLVLERVAESPELVTLLEQDEALAGHLLDVVEHAPYLAQQVLREPARLKLLASVRQGAPVADDYAERAAALDSAGALRRFFQQEQFRLQCASLCLGEPIFTTLARHSELADAVICAAYRLAVAAVVRGHPPAQPGYGARDQLLVVALGRLGMREFDLASDADLVFVLPDEDRSEAVFWTRVAERLIHLLTAYTGEGVLFPVDTRLRPNGREGALVQTASAYQQYFASGAEAWEGISYMKARTVAGHADRGSAFLRELQEVDWRRYGQGGRSREELRQMRLRLEREQGTTRALRASVGGYYDIDFALMYLRLKGAGLFFKVLNTPERIDIVEKMGHLERADAEHLREAATLFRAVDHGLRLYSGHSEGDLPEHGAQRDAVAAMVCRWMPGWDCAESLGAVLDRVRLRTREFFTRVFG